MGENNLVLTFIRKLIEDMEKKLGQLAEVKTFHAYCKKLLHQKNRRIELVPYLTKIIESDSKNLGYGLSDFDAKFQVLDESSREIRFYLERGRYYEVVSFNDSVYIVLKAIRNGDIELPKFNQIVIDEYQDFNPLEVAFIDQLQKYGNILIVGDDDQAIYTGRNSSAVHLRQKYHSGNYKLFDLPFCSRCPSVIVDAVNGFIKNTQINGLLKDRIPRPFSPFLEDKREINDRYPKIITANISMLPTISQYIKTEIAKIPSEDISDSWEEGEEYPTVLIVGRSHYIREIHKGLKSDYPFAKLVTSETAEYSLPDGYEMLLRQEDSNLGWRILAEILLDPKKYGEILRQTIKHNRIVELIPSKFVSKHKRVIELLRQKQVMSEVKQDLKGLLGENYNIVADRFFAEEQKEEPANKTMPSVLLTSFQGCKGLSGGHVFIVGANDGDIPKLNPKNGVSDVECCKFTVALTRTRRCCHILSNKWLNNPKTKDNKWAKNFQPTRFLKMIPRRNLEDRGYIKSSNLR